MATPASEPQASVQILIEVIKIIPALVWIVFTVAIIGLFYRPIRDVLLPRLQSVKILGFEASFVKAVLAKEAEKNRAGSEEQRTALARRAERLAGVLAGARVLLVNDEPDDMSAVIDILSSMKITVVVVTNTEAALKLLESKKYDVVVSDMSRGDDDKAGVELLNQSIKRGINRPTIFTVGYFEPRRGTPPFAFAITDKVDDLLNYVFDALERVRG